MKILGLLGGLYTELKRLNDALEHLTAFNKKKQREKENPLSEMTEAEILKIKFWIRAQLKKKNISIESLVVENPYALRSVTRFLNSDTQFNTATARNFIAAALGYASFSDLVEAWREGGAA